MQIWLTQNSIINCLLAKLCLSCQTKFNQQKLQTMKKLLILAVLIGFYTAANCQHHEKRTFLRIFDVSGKAIVRGHLISESQTNLIIRRGSDALNIPRSDIGKIKEG